MKQDIILLIAAIALHSCGSKTSETPQHNDEPATEVSIAVPTQGNIKNDIELLATTEYLRHWSVTTPVNAYVTATYAQKGQSVKTGTTLFRIETKERQALGESLPMAQNIGRMAVKAPQSGVITNVLQQSGCYVQEGESLALMADAGSMVFRIDVPYEYIKQVRRGRTCRVVLPGGTTLKAKIDTQLSTMTEESQSVQVLARTKAPFLPEGMNVRVLITPDGNNTKHWLLPKEAVQSNEQMTEFWIMEVGWNGRAKRVNVSLGNSDSTSVEILSPQLNADDKVITNGSYGLENDARISIRPTAVK